MSRHFGISRVFSLLRRDVLAICAVALLCDIVAGIVIPTFSLYAKELGASVVLVGALTTISGLTSFVCSFPLGILSDRIGRRRVLLIGTTGFGTAMTLLALAPSPYLLIPGRILLGMAMVGTFWIAAAHLGDIVGADERGVAFGLMMTAMGIGFAVGPLIGGRIAERAGLATSYLFAAGVAAVAILVVATRISREAPKRDAAGSRRGSLRESIRLGRDRNLVAAAIGSAAASLAFGGAVATFFPLYGSEHGVSDETLGRMFAARAITSAAIRLPCGALVGAIGSRRVMAGALGLELIAVTGFGLTESSVVLGVLLSLEGVASGAFMTSGHAFIAEHTVTESRGAALGLYSTAGSLSNALAPLGLGLVASALGLATVFLVSGVLIAAGLVATLRIWAGAPVRAQLVGQVGGEA
jgi:MFS family permease